MKKSIVTIFRRPWDAGSYATREKWFQERTEALSYPSELEGEKAAEEAFHLTNAPEEYLEEAQKDLLKILDFKGPSLSVGDIVRVESVVRGSKKPEYFLCKSIGWEKYEADPIQLLKHLVY